MPAVFDHMADGEALAVFRRDDRPAEERQGELAAVRVSRNQQAEAPAQRRKDIGIVSDREDRAPVPDLAHGLANIVRAFPEIADSDEPELRVAAPDPDRAVLENFNSIFLQSRPNPVRTECPIMI